MFLCILYWELISVKENRIKNNANDHCLYLFSFVFLLWRALFDVVLSKSLSHKVLWPGDQLFGNFNFWTSFHHSAFPNPLLVAPDCFSLLRFWKFNIFWCRRDPLGIDLFGPSGHWFEWHKSFEQLVYARGYSFLKNTLQEHLGRHSE